MAGIVLTPVDIAGIVIVTDLTVEACRLDNDINDAQVVDDGKEELSEGRVEVVTDENVFGIGFGEFDGLTSFITCDDIEKAAWRFGDSLLCFPSRFSGSTILPIMAATSRSLFPSISRSSSCGTSFPFPASPCRLSAPLPASSCCNRRSCKKASLGCDIAG